MQMRVRFWGVRGSIACPGPSTIRYGGNTPCIEVRCGGHVLIFDAGTGLRPLARLDAQIAARSAHDLRPLQHLPPQRELHGLAQSIDQLLARLRAHLAREKALVHDAAHELRTPMAVIATQAHVLAQAPEGLARAQASEALTRAVQRAAHLSE